MKPAIAEADSDYAHSPWHRDHLLYSHSLRIGAYSRTDLSTEELETMLSGCASDGESLGKITIVGGSRESSRNLNLSASTANPRIRAALEAIGRTAHSSHKSSNRPQQLVGKSYPAMVTSALGRGNVNPLAPLCGGRLASEVSDVSDVDNTLMTGGCPVDSDSESIFDSETDSETDSEIELGSPHNTLGWALPADNVNQTLAKTTGGGDSKDCDQCTAYDDSDSTDIMRLLVN